MALSIDQLLAAESSSDEGLTVAEALAQGEVSDDDARPPTGVQPAGEKEEDAGAGGAATVAPPSAAGPAASHLPTAPDGAQARAQEADALSDDLEEESPLERGRAVGLQEALAMQDSSDEEAEAASEAAAPAAARPAAAAAPAPLPPASPRPPLVDAGIAGASAGEARGRVTAQAVAVAPRGATAESEDPVLAFMRAPFAWCLEHERAMLLHNVEKADRIFAGDEGGAEAAGVDAGSMVDARTCSELRRLLAQDLGLPTCVVAHPKLVGVGTLRGAVVLLNPQVRDAPPNPQILCPPGTDDVAAVTAVAFSPDGSSLLVGHRSGHLALWDLAAQRVAAAVREAHMGPVLSVAFCRSSWQYALSADASGNVVLLTFTSTLGRRGCQCTLLLEQSANIGVTLRILPVPQAPGVADHPADTQCLVALCATNATVLLTLHPTVQVLQKMRYHTKDALAVWLPDAVWLRQEMRDGLSASNLAAFDPVLCITFGQSIHLMKASFEGGQAPQQKGEFALRPLHKYTWTAPIRNVVAFNESLLGILDGANKLSVVQLPAVWEEGKSALGEAPQLVPVHTQDVSGWSLVYHNQTSLDGSRDARAHHGALAVFGGRARTLYAGGMKEVWSVQVGRWGQHVEELVGKDQWAAALRVFLALRRGSLPPLLDFPSATWARQKAVDSRATQVIQSYLVSRLQPDTPRAQAREMCSIVVGACIEMHLWSVLYKTVFECFKAVGHVHAYCNTLEPFIVEGRIPRGQMDSEVLASILQSYALPLEEEQQTALAQLKAAPSADGGRTGEEALQVDCDHCPSLFPMARRLQQLVLSVEVTQLDLNLAIRLFTHHRLWTALVHVYCSLGDYVSPLELLVGECTQLARRCAAPAGEGEPVHSGGERALLRCFLVRKLFYFLHRCFELRCFPLDPKDGLVMAHPSSRAITELLRCMLRPEPPMFLRLLRLSPVGLFSVLSSLYTSPSAGHALQSHTQAEGTWVISPEFHPLTLGTLFQAIEGAFEGARRQATEDDQALPENAEREFMWFMARAIPRAKLSLPVDRCMQVVEHLLASGRPPAPDAAAAAPSFGAHSRDEAQQLLIKVLAECEPFAGREQREAFIGRAVQQGLFAVASWLHERHGEFDKALDCRLQASELREDVFEYIITQLGEESCDRHLSALVEATLQRLPKLVALDPERCAMMVCEQFASAADHGSVLERLRGYPLIEMQYLETLLVRRKRSHWKTAEEQQAFFNAHVVRYIELLCAHAPGSVLPFVTENEALPLRECLELCRRHGVTDASIHLLERTGDFQLVLELLLGDYSAALEKLNATFTESSDQHRSALARVVKRLAALAAARSQGGDAKEGSPEAPWWQGLPDAQRCVELLNNAYEMSSRNSNIMTEALLEELWFGILGRTIRWQEHAAVGKRASKRAEGFAAALEALSAQAMTGVLAYLSLPRSLKWICSEFSASKLGIWKAPMQSMLSGLNFQLGLLDAARAVAAQDVLGPFAVLKRCGSRGAAVSPGAAGGGPLRVCLGQAAPRRATDARGSRSAANQ